MSVGTVLSAALAATFLVAAGCGGDSQTAGDPNDTFEVSVRNADFPSEQRLGRKADLTLTIENAGAQAMPNLAVTIDGFSYRNRQPGLADPERPVWVVDKAPPGSTTAYNNTFSLAELQPGERTTATWTVVPVKPGERTVTWRIVGDLAGNAKTIQPDGSAARGDFRVRIASSPVYDLDL